jgi:hypothetical protein
MAGGDKEIRPAAACATTGWSHIDSRDPLGLLLRKRLKLDWLSVWVIALLIYGPIEKLIIPYLGGYLNLGGGIRQWTPHVESPLTGFVEFPLFFAFYIWTAQGIPEQFLRLERSTSFGNPTRYSSFLGRVRRRYDSSVWTVLSTVAAIDAVFLMHSVIWGEQATVGPWFGDRPAARILSLVLIGIVSYAIAQTLIREILAILSLRHLWKEMGDELIVHPYHADGAGGLGIVGRHPGHLCRGRNSGPVHSRRALARRGRAARRCRGQSDLPGQGVRPLGARRGAWLTSPSRRIAPCNCPHSS